MTKRILILAGVALVVGAVLAWYGASTLFADGVAADVNGTGGGLAILPLVAAVGGTAAVVWALCALAWQFGKLREQKRLARTAHAAGRF